MIEITGFKDVTQIRLSKEMDGRALYWVSAYLVDGLLIDTGSAHTAPELFAFLSDKKPEQVVNTHFHEDHVGGNSIIREKLGIEIYAHRNSVPHIAQKPRLFPYQEMVFGYPEPVNVKTLGDRVKTANHEFLVIETPGHSAGHIVLLEESTGYCFSGDIFTRETIKFTRAEENMPQLVKSMKKILSHAGDRLILFTAPGRIVENGREALAGSIKYLEELETRVKSLSGKGHDIESIVTEIFGGENVFSQLTNGQFSSANLVRSLLGLN